MKRFTIRKMSGVIILEITAKVEPVPTAELRTTCKYKNNSKTFNDRIARRREVINNFTVGKSSAVQLWAIENDMDIRALASMTTHVVAVVHAKLPLQKEKERQLGNVC